MHKMLKFQIQALSTPIEVRLICSRFSHLPTVVTVNLVNDLTRFFMHVEAHFSPQRPDSWVCQFQRGELMEADFSPEFQEVYRLAIQAEQMTQNAFNPFFAGDFDPTGLIKGWAIHRAFALYVQPLLSQGSVIAAAINGGGDVQLAVVAHSDFVWQVGVEAPTNLTRVIHRYGIRNGAMATSMASGSRVSTPIVCQETHQSLQQATILAPSLATADMLATTAIAMGRNHFEDFLQAQNLPVKSLLVTATDDLVEL